VHEELHEQLGIRVWQRTVAICEVRVAMCRRDVGHYAPEGDASKWNPTAEPSRGFGAREFAKRRAGKRSSLALRQLTMAMTACQRFLGSLTSS
jgi:hypothetical protein